MRTLRRARVSVPPASGGISWVGGLTLFAVVSVLVLVSLPRLRDLAIHENERDALLAASALAEALAEGTRSEAGAGVLRMDELVRRASLARQLPDAEFLEEGRLMRSNGYLFQVLEVPGARPLGVWGSPWGVLRTARAAEAPRATLGIVAWPWIRDHTGSVALVVTPDGAALGHPNRDEGWEGLRSRPALGRGWVRSGWRRIRAAR